MQASHPRKLYYKIGIIKKFSLRALLNCFTYPSWSAYPSLGTAELPIVMDEKLDCLRSHFGNHRFLHCSAMTSGVFVCMDSEMLSAFPKTSK